jgi:hypothetical protein
MFLVSSVQGRSLADAPLPAPEVREIWPPSKKFCVVMNPEPSTTTVYRIADDGKRTRQWVMPGWFRVAYLADDGDHLIVGHGGINLLPLDVTAREPMIRFFKRGKLVNMVTLGELLKDQSSLKRTASHYLWGNYLGLDKQGHFVVETVEDRKLAFDVATGKRWIPQKQATATEKQAVGPAQ